MRLVLILFALGLSLPSNAKLTNDCSCPNGDSIELENAMEKVPEPKKLRSIEQIFTNTSCVTTNKKSGNLSALKAALNDIQTPKGLKTPDEILDYFSCYRADDQQFCHFRNTLSSHIALACESSGLPFAVQACLFYQESKFNPNAKSNIPDGYEEVKVKKKNSKGKMVTVTERKMTYKHANGYIQFMDETANEIEPVISGSMKEWQSKIANAEDEIKKEETLKKTSKSSAVKKRSEDNIRYWETMITTWEAKIEARKVWDAYWEDTNKPAPTTVNKVDMKNPRDAFALSMTKQTYDLALMDHVSYSYKKTAKSKILQINKMGAGDSAVFLAGAYNAGRAGLANKCGKVTSAKQCMDIYWTAAKKCKNVHNCAPLETWIHMSAIDRCSKKGSTDNTEFDKDKLSFEKKKECKGWECK